MKPSRQSDVQPSAEGQNALGNLLVQQGKISAAIASFQTAIALNSDLAEAHCNLGILLQGQGKIDAARDSLKTAIALKPNLVEAHCNLGILLAKTGKIDQAIESFRQAIVFNPSLKEAHYNLGNALRKQGQRKEAILSYQTVLDLDPNYHPARFSLVVAQLGIIYANPAEIQLARSEYHRHLQSLINYYEAADEQQRSDGATGVGSDQPFYLAYQGQSDRDLQQLYGGLIQQLMASRYPQWSRPIPMPKLAANSKIRLGFVSGHFNHHSVWKMPLQGWVENLDRSEFELFGYFTGDVRDEQTIRAAKAFDRFEHNFLSVEQWANTIAQDKLHILIFPEFGMDTMTIQLGCLRLAPVQLTSWGHPETSGLPTIDYFLSSDLMEPPDAQSQSAQSHYSENLVRLPNLGICYKPISIKPKTVTRKELGIKENEIMFWCCQSLFKYLPQHDDVFPRIAQELVKAKFVFIQEESKLSTNIFRQRLADAFEQFQLNYQDHCVFLPRLDKKAFAGTTAIADVYLDNLGWSGCNTTMESIADNLPIVTLPGELMRCRHTAAILQMMGVVETIAQTKEEYIQIAVHLGQNPSYRQDISQKIAVNKHKCYGDLEPVRALENFLLAICHKPRRFDSEEVKTAFLLAEEYFQNQQINEAQQEYIKVVAAQPNHVEAWHNLGAIAQQQKDFAAAEQYFMTAVKIQPNLLKSWFSLGNLRHAQGQFAMAEQAYRQALDLRPSAPICNNLGYVLQQQNKWSEAVEYYQQALSLMPNCREAEVNLGNALFAQEKLSTPQQNHYAELNYQLGLGRQQVRDYQTAEIYFRQSVLMQPKFVKAHYELGRILHQLRKLTEALECYQQVLKLDANFGEAYYSLGQVYQDLGDLSQSTDNFRQGIKLINPEYALTLASAQDTAPPSKLISELMSELICEPPPAISGTVTVGDYQYPEIPSVPQETKRPFWSVVIPVVNRPEYFLECLASVLAQWSSEDMEIIVLDNGSNPPQCQIPDDLGRGIIRYYRLPETIPLQENWNKAVSLCRGQWIHLLHHDDYVLPGFYARLQAGLANSPESVGAAFTGYENINQERQIIFSQQHNLENYRGIVADWILRIGVSCPLSPPSLVIRRAAYEKLGGYKLDLLYTCDWELYKRNASFYDWWYEPGILAHYRQQSNSVTIAENLTGASGFDHLRAIEISESYLPPELCAEITAKSRANFFPWCLDRATIPLRSGNLEGAANLLLAALKINGSPGAVDRLTQWLEQKFALPLVKQLAQSGDSTDAEQNILTQLSRSIL